jgi:uncharacterized protein YdaT
LWPAIFIRKQILTFGVVVIKTAVNIHRTKIPKWAENFLKSFEILDFLQVIKVTKRQFAFDKLLNDEEYKKFREEFRITELTENIYINKKRRCSFLLE